MLLLTDRLNEGLQLQQTLRLVQPCTVLGLHQASTRTLSPAIIICDVALDNMGTIDLLRAALAKHRTAPTTPVLCLTRDPSQLTLAQARAVGATAILPSQTPHNRILDAIRQLIGSNRSANGSNKPRGPGVQASIREATSALSTLLTAAQRRQPISTEALDVGGDIILTAVGEAKIRAWLDVVWKHDDVTYQHSLLVAGLAAAFAIDLGLPLKHQRLLSQAALIHDIGKAHIPHQILNKAGRLSVQEMVVMRSHAALGHEMLVGQKGLDPRLLDVVRHHHEYLDGTGYPDGLSGQEISYLVRLVTICDIYGALIERRSYKAPTPPQQALAHLEGMGGKLDGGLVKAFYNVVREG